MSTNIKYDNSVTGLEATSVQGAIDEIALSCGNDAVALNPFNGRRVVRLRDLVMTQMMDDLHKALSASYSNMGTLYVEEPRMQVKIENIDLGSGPFKVYKKESE